jgi:hypothetical protein
VVDIYIFTSDVEFYYIDLGPIWEADVRARTWDPTRPDAKTGADQKMVLAR